MALSSALPRNLGLCAANVSEVALAVNEAQEKLIIDPLAPDEGWWGGWVKMLFNVQAIQGAAYIVTPADIARVIVLDVCNRPIALRNGFYEYLQFGIGLKPEACPRGCSPNTTQAFERDSVFTQNDFPASPQIIRAFPSNNADLGRRIVFQGLDQNGVTVTNVDTTTQASALGEVVYLAAPFASTSTVFSKITGILKDATVGHVDLFAIDPITGASSLLGSMDPNETTAFYRRYLINGLKCNCCNTPGGVIQISAQCKIDFVPVISPSDYLTIPNIPALIEETQANKASRMDSAAAAAKAARHHSAAIALLNGQLDHYEGKVQTAVRVPIFGSDRVRLNPI